MLLFAYCLGYASGLYLGSIIESKIALGTSSIQIMVNNEYIDDVGNYLKEKNLGFTILEGHGSKSEMFVVIIVLSTIAAGFPSFKACAFNISFSDSTTSAGTSSLDTYFGFGIVYPPISFK